MRRCAMFYALAIFAIPALAGAEVDVIRVGVKQPITAGSHQVMLSVYATEHGNLPIATESRTAKSDATGALVIPLEGLAAVDGWVGVRVGSGAEGRRVRIVPNGSTRVVLHVVTDAAITANGIIESVSQGFRFPDNTVQTSAATVSGGVPSVNGIGGAVTITGAGTTSVGTAGSTITVTGPGFGSPVAVGSANAEGAASTIARSDHVHAHGDQAGGTLHAAATTGTAGFMSAADKTKLNGTVGYVRTVVVIPSGTAAQNGTDLRNAIANIVAPSALSPFLVKLEPGNYHIGGTALNMRSYVDVEGSGEGVTFINSTFGAPNQNLGAINGATNSELRNLSISADAGSGAPYTTGFYASGSGGAMRLSNVTIKTSGATIISNAVYANSSANIQMFRCSLTATGDNGTEAVYAGFFTTVNISNCTITGSGTVNTAGVFNVGLYVNNSNAVVTIDSSTIVGTGAGFANYGISVIGGTVTVMNSTIRAETAGNRYALDTIGNATLKVSHSFMFSGGGIAANKGTVSTLMIAASLLEGTIQGGPTCLSNYNASYAAVACP